MALWPIGRTWRSTPPRARSPQPINGSRPRRSRSPRPADWPQCHITGADGSSSGETFGRVLAECLFPGCSPHARPGTSRGFPCKLDERGVLNAGWPPQRKCPACISQKGISSFVKYLEKIALMKNIGSSWLGLAVNIATGIVISPYILHKLGDEAFGLWVLVFSVTGYYGLFDLGIRSSIVRYVAKYSARADHNQLNRLVNTAFFTYSAIGIICLLLTF